MWQMSLGRAYGRHLHTLVRCYADRTQSHGTFFLRNRPELELIRRLLDRKPSGAAVNLAVLACSKGPEVYSILWTIRSARPDLKLTTYAVDISQEILDFARQGVYALSDSVIPHSLENNANEEMLIRNTYRDQPVANRSLFGRMNQSEMHAMFDLEGDRAKVKSWLKAGITWLVGDAAAPEIIAALGPQDIVVANRFLCHMEPVAAERCLRNVARLVAPDGYLFVSGVDLAVRTKVAHEFGWQPVTDLIREIHEGDSSLRDGWPLQYWGLEPFSTRRADRIIRYASVFQTGGPRASEIAAASQNRNIPQFTGAAKCAF
jgi:chemotaxis methyl-accepting protein methylase